MPKGKTKNLADDDQLGKPALSPEAQESKMIALAMNLAEKRLIEGTATSAEVVHFLKLGSSKERLEKRILEKQEELISAKTENLQSAKRMEALYTEAITAMRRYSGNYSSEQVEEEDIDEY